MAAIVLIHGVGQEQLSADVLESQWLPALAGGVRIAGHGDLADLLWRGGRTGGVEARMAFYGDLFRRPDQQGGADNLEDVDETTRALADALAVAWLQGAATRSADPRQLRTAAQELAHVEAAVGAEEMGGRAMARSALAGLARLRFFARVGMGIAERFVVRSLVQVTRYLTDPSVRQDVQARVEDLVDGDTKVLVGHSLGSIVAFEAAHRVAGDLPLLVTLGSPLGLPTIVLPRLVPQPPSFPPRVRRWVNVADRDDVVASAPDLGGLFGAVPAGCRFEAGWTVDNGARPHDADFYLGKAAVGGPIAEALLA